MPTASVQLFGTPRPMTWPKNTARIPSGGTNPPSPPAAPTTPVTAPTCSAATTRATSAKVARTGAERRGEAEERDRREREEREPRRDERGERGDDAEAAVSTGTGWNRSESQPPIGRIDDREHDEARGAQTRRRPW